MSSIIRAGTLCWLTRMTRNPRLNGRVVEVVSGPEAYDTLDADRVWGYTVIADWILAHRNGKKGAVARREELIPFSDPEPDWGTHYSEPKAPMTRVKS